MRRTFVLALSVAMGLLTLPDATRAQTEVFLQIEGVEGESMERDCRGCILVESFEWGAVNAADLSARTAGRAVFSDLSIFKPVDKASPVLLQACATGKRFAQATLRVVSAGREFYRLELTDVLVSANSVSAAHGSQLPMEALSLAFGRAEWTYTAYGADGRMQGEVVGSWDLRTNAP